MKRIITTLFVLAIAIGVLAPISFSLTQNNVVAVQPTTAYAQSTTQPDQAVFQNIGECGVVFGSMANCLAYILYFIPFYVGGQVLDLAARFLDFTATLTLSSQMFSSAGFLQVGWAMMRDFANMFFIFVLLYIALCMMLGIKKGGDPKSMIVSVVCIAIIINFSMFITDVIIDTSNVLALVFYNQITVTAGAGGAVASDTALTALQNGVVLKDANGNPTGTTLDTVQPKQIGLALASAFHPQIFTTPEFWNTLKQPGADGSTTDEVASGKMILILLVMGIIFFVAAWSFFVAAFSFMGRMVELFVLIIFSPLAFVSYIVPGLRGMDRFGWSKWWGSLIKTCFAAPIYFLMILLITIILNAGLFGGAAAASTAAITPNTWIITLVGSVIVPVVFLWIMLTEATKYAQKASGTVGEKLGGMASAAVKGIGAATGGAVIGAAAGGAAAIGRNTIGRTSEKLLSGSTGQRLLKAGEGTGVSAWLARRTIEAGKAGQKASFDVRATGAGQKLSKATGMKFESFGTLSTAAAKGGRESQRAREAAEQAKKEKLLQNKDARKDIDKVKEQRDKDVKVAKEKLHHEDDHKKTAQEEHNNAKDELKANENTLKSASKVQDKATAEFDKIEKEKTAAEALLKAAEAQQKAAETDLQKAHEQQEKAQRDYDAASPADKAAAKKTLDDANAALVAKSNTEQTAKDGVKARLMDVSNITSSSQYADAKTAKDTANTKMGEAEANYKTAFAKVNGEHGTQAHLKKAQENYKKANDEVHDLEHGKPESKRRKFEGPDIDPATNKPRVNAKGEVVDKKGVSREDAMADMGTHDLETAASNAEKSNFKNHMFNRMKGRYSDTEEKRDALGNITTMSSSGKVKARTLSNRIIQTAQAATTSAAPAFIVGTAVAGPLGGLAAALGAMLVAGTLEAKQSGKRGERANMDTQHEAEKTVLKNVDLGKATPTHKAVDTGIADTASYITGALGEVVGKTTSALGVKGGGGGHGKEHGDDHGGGHGAAEAHGTDHGAGDHGGGDHGGGGHGAGDGHGGGGGHGAPKGGH